MRCYLHRFFGEYGFVRTRLFGARTSAGSSTPRATVPRSQPVTSHEFGRDDRWVRQLERSERALVGDADWRTFTTATNPSSACRCLADIARALKRADDAGEQAVASVVDSAATGAPQIVRRVAAATIQHVVNQQLGGLAHAARATLTLGVFLCVVNNVPADRCACRAEWSRSEGREATRNALEHAIPETVSVDNI